TALSIVKRIAEAGLGWLKSGGNFGLGALTDDNIHRLFNAEAFQKLAPEDQKLVSDSILYLVGGTNKIPFINKLAGPTDGVVPLNNQRRKEYGFVGAFFNKV